MDIRLVTLTIGLPLLTLSYFGNINASSFKITNMICESFNKSWIVFNECRLRVPKRNMIVLNVNGSLLQTVNIFHVNIQVLKKANGYKPWLYNFTVDVCEFHRRRHNPILNLIFGIFKDFSNLDHKCPYNVGIIYVKNLYIRPEMLRLPLPTGEYQVITKYMFDMKLQFITKFYFAFVED